MSAATRAKQRARALQLAGQGTSSKAVAKRVGVSESTVRRWRAAERAEQDGATGTEPAEQLLTVALDDDLRDHLAVLAEGGHDAQAAVAMALELIADSYRSAWDYGTYERGTPPEIRVRVKGDWVPKGSW